MDLFEKLIQNGFTPMNAIMFLAIFGLSKVVVTLHKQNEENRNKSFVTVTEQVKSLEESVENMAAEKAELNSEIRILKDRAHRVNRCPLSGCPNKL